MNEILLQIISLGALLLIAKIFILIILNMFKIKYPFKNLVSRYRLELLFLISLMGTVGSLLLSIYFKLEACELCWYQRIFLFVMPVITAIALIKKDMSAHIYVYYLALIGLGIALYHSLLQSKLFASDSVFCNPFAAVDCAVPSFTYFGFVTVPVISFAVFLLISYIAYAPNKK
jgi:disulfide bond formation protein DsbB